MFKKLLIAVSVVGVVGALFAAGVAFAQTQTPPAGAGYGRGPGAMPGGRGGMMWGEAPMGGPHLGQGGRGELMLMHTDMVAAFAEALDLEADVINERLAAGETMREIALAEGLSEAEFLSVMQTARAQALTQAVADGVLSQEQADWMLSRGGGMGRGMGRGMGMGDCPYAPEAATP